MDNEKLASLASIDDISSRLRMPVADVEDNLTPEVVKLLDTTDPSKIFLSSDWHFFKNHYKKEANYVNTQKIVQWCKEHIKPDDVFMYLGDISFRYANDEDKAESAKIMSSIPGHKILIIGNHDEFCGQNYFTECGFEHALTELRWREILFTHRPIKMDIYPEEVLNIHGHIHNLKLYNTTDGKRNINVYPMFYDNKPVTLRYILSHKEQLVKQNVWNNNVGLGESAFSEAYNINGKPKVYYSKEISPRVISYMANMYKDRLTGNIAIKLHVGEEGNQNALPARLIKPLRDELKATYVDSNVAYKSKRKTTEGHLETAEKHGFDNLDVLDADGDFPINIPTVNKVKKELEKFEAERPDYIPQCTTGPHLEKVHIGDHIKNYDSMIVYSHFKGHIMAGYGGAIKNIGMGIPSGARGKMEVHGKDFVAGPDFLERLVESAGAIADYFDGKIIYINVLKNMSVDCDCDEVAHDPTIPDIGVLVSDDIIAIEQASMDLIRNCHGNKDLMQRIADKGGYHQIEYGAWLGLGSRDYNLYSLDNTRLKLEHGFVRELSNTRAGRAMHVINESKTILNGYSVKDVQKFFDSIPQGDSEYGQTHKSYKETIYRNMESGKGFLELYRSKDGPNIGTVAIVVHPDYRGQGVGTKLVKGAISAMKKLDLNRLEWYTKKDNHASYELARKCGFDVDPKLSNDEWYTLYYGEVLNESARAINETKRSNLPDSAFGLPDERKYPLDTAQHVRSAIRLFGHCPEAKKKQLARRISRAAKRYGISIPETTQVYKYLHEAAFLEAEGPVGNVQPVTYSMIPESVKAIVFDIGSVLADADTIGALQRNPEIPNDTIPAIYEYVTKKLFYRDKSSVDVKKYNILQVRDYFDKTAPEEILPYRDAIFATFAPAMYYYEYTFSLIEYFKSKGYSVYYLSNWDFYSYQLESTFFSKLINAMDGGLFSFETDYEKPDPEFFKIFFEKYDLDPHTCAFFDDRVDNVETARSLGMHAYLFDNQTTPETLMSDGKPNNDTDTVFVVDNNAGFDIIKLSDIHDWYIGEVNPNQHEPLSSSIFSSVSLAVEAFVKSKSCNGQDNTVCLIWAKLNPQLPPEDITKERCMWVVVGKLKVNTADATFEWVMQSMLKRVNDVIYDIGHTYTGLSEWAMAACNPVHGIRKPFILKVGCDTGGIINTKQYAFSPDLINDKYLAINEEGKLDFVDASEYNDYMVEEYEYIGDRAMLAKIYEAYETGKVVDNTFFYTALTGKPMLTEDQIDFDENFRKVDFDFMREKKLSEQATFKSKADLAFGGVAFTFPVNESAVTEQIPYLKKYSKYGEIFVQRDTDGYYFFNCVSNKRSTSVDDPDMLTETMLRSIF